MTKVEWDYTDLAASYVSRPDYSPEAIDAMLAIARIESGAKICDIGAGVAHLTIPLLRRGMVVDAVEPNDAMRSWGIKRTQAMKGVTWHDGTGEATGMASGAYDFVTFGSSFNVCDRAKALIEVDRLLKPGRWFACMWNHRDLADPLQDAVESTIRSLVPGYGYGTRREDQTAVIAKSGLFTTAVTVSGPILHRVPATEWVEAWRSHATLARQAGDDFHKVVERIEALVADRTEIDVPYTTRIWVAQKLAKR